jgi:alkylation response protein AidB-like acyl-CoA dehydrogenase
LAQRWEAERRESVRTAIEAVKVSNARTDSYVHHMSNILLEESAEHAKAQRRAAALASVNAARWELERSAAAVELAGVQALLDEAHSAIALRDHACSSGTPVRESIS